MGYGYYGGYGYGRMGIMDFLGPILAIVVGLIVLSIVFRVVKSAMGRGGGSGMLGGQGLPSFKGRTPEQKKVIKYFNSTGILGAIFRISDAEFDMIMRAKVDECRSWINARALNIHGMDADEVREISPVLVENYSLSSSFYKMFKDLSFRASGYQLSYLLFSEKQVYVYCYTFDLTNANTTERTREYFYEDITNIDVTQRKIEHLNPRPLIYLLGGIGAILLGFVALTAMAAAGSMIMFWLRAIIGVAAIIAGIVILGFLGFTRSVVDNVVLRLTVPGDEFLCPMNPENIDAVQGMKAKLREKKK